MAVAAAAVLDLRVLAGVAANHISAQSCGAAGLDGRHHLELVKADMAGIGGAPCGAMIAEDVRDLQSGLRHGADPSSRTPRSSSPPAASACPAGSSPR